MSEFVDLVLSFPTVVFTVAGLIFIGFWTVTSLVGAGADALEDFDFDLDADLEADVDVELDGGAAAGGLLKTGLQLLGLGRMPLLLGLSLLSLSAWFVSVVLMTVGGGLGIDDAGSAAGVLLGVVVLILSLVAGTAVVRAVGTRLSHVFTTTTATRQREFIGSTCTVTTDRVDATFGQAEVRDAEGGSLIVQVRCAKPNTFSAGDQALMFDLDEDHGTYQIAPAPTLGIT